MSNTENGAPKNDYKKIRGISELIADIDKAKTRVLLEKRNITPQKVPPTDKEYEKRLQKSLRKDTETLKKVKEDRIEKSVQDWRTKVGLTFAKAEVSLPIIKDRIVRLKTRKGVHNTSLILRGNMGVGKAQPLTEPVLTPKGWTKFGSIKVGQNLVGVNGEPVKILAIHPQGRKQIFKVSFEDGGWTECDSDHLWTIVTETGTTTTTTHTLQKIIAQNETTVHIPLMTPVDKETIEQGSQKLYTILRNTHTQHVITEHKNFTLITITKKLSKKMWKQLAELAFSIGALPTQTSIKNRYTIRKENGAPLTRRMVSIVPTTVKEAQCVTVDNPNGLYVTRHHIVTHNTWTCYAYLNAAISAGVVTAGQIVLGTETNLLGRVTTAGYKKSETLDALLNERNKIWFIDDVGQGFFSDSQKRTEVWFELIDHIYVHQLTILITTNLSDAGLKNWLGFRAYDRLRSIVGDGYIEPAKNNRRESVLAEEEEKYITSNPS